MSENFILKPKKLLTMFFACNDYHAEILKSLSKSYITLIPPNEFVVPWEKDNIENIQKWLKKNLNNNIFIIFIFHVSMRADIKLLKKFLINIDQFEFVMVLRGNESEKNVIYDIMLDLFKEINISKNSIIKDDPQWEILLKEKIELIKN